MRHAEACGVICWTRRNPRRQSRWWEESKSGDELPQIVKGPLSVGEMMAWAHSVGGGGEVHAFRMRCPSQTSGLGLEES